MNNVTSIFGKFDKNKSSEITEEPIKGPFDVLRELTNGNYRFVEDGLEELHAATYDSDRATFNAVMGIANEAPEPTRPIANESETLASLAEARERRRQEAEQDARSSYEAAA